jgi:isoleucyl-tRNA synthetase
MEKPFQQLPSVPDHPGLGVHHLWGRTYKDVFQRYKALHGFDQRFQNGFDCQGLWVEVKVERELGLNSKPEIEDYTRTSPIRPSSSGFP